MKDSWCYAQCYIYWEGNITCSKMLHQPQGTMVGLMLTHWCQSECIYNHLGNYVRVCLQLHCLWNLVSLSIWGHQQFAKNVTFKQVKSFMLYNIRTTYLAKKEEILSRIHL